MTWQTSDRRSRLPRDWPKIRTRILKRDPVCRCRGCERCTPTGCPRTSTDCDHVLPIDDHRDSNLQGLCRDCHADKSTREGLASRSTALRRRPTEPHPGLTPGG